MAMYTVHSIPYLVEYRAHICSKATLFNIICVLLMLFLSLIIAYRSEGFWKRSDWYTEQPSIHFKKDILVWLELADGIDYVAWSSFANLNQLLDSHLRIPLIKSREDDWNGDGVNDGLDLTLEFPLSKETVQSATLILIFDYQLKKFCRLQMEGLTYFQQNSPANGLQWKIVADLTLKQKIPLPHAGLHILYNKSVIARDSVFAEDYDVGRILEKYSERNVTTVVENAYYVWKSGRSFYQPFEISIKLTYPQQLIRYQPGFWHMIKWAWVQYLSIVLVLLYVFNTIKTFVFQNQVLETIIKYFKVHNH